MGFYLDLADQLSIWMDPGSQDAARAIEALEAENKKLRDGVEAIRDATLAGNICDDVAGFDNNQTLHDFCCFLLEWSGNQTALDLVHKDGQ